MRKFLRKAEEEDDKATSINDNIHGHIQVPPVLRAIIDTPQFDRLRGLRQLGTAHYVYPAAKHSRWEHSLGVMHLAGEMMDHLIKTRPGWADEKDKICVMMAGLCHDLGHGPFSHLWENFVTEARNGHKWLHEKSSIDILQFIIEENDLMPIFYSHGLTENDITFVKELIYGPFQQGSDDYIGRGKEKFFLYEIVANKTNSIDVDKWDYMLRDDSALSIGVTFDYKRFILNTDITEDKTDGRRRLSLRDKEADSVKEMFMDRARLHRKGYQHRTIKIIDRMMLDALLSADDHFFLTGPDGKPFKLSQATDNVENFCQLTDEFLVRSLQFSTSPELAKTRSILTRITKRNLYKLVRLTDSVNEPVSFKDLQQTLEEIVDAQGTILQRGDLTILRKRVNMGMGNSNPVEKVSFFNKRGGTVVFTSDQLRRDLPRDFSSQTFLLVCRRTDQESLKEANELFQEWAKAVSNQEQEINLSIL